MLNPEAANALVGGGERASASDLRVREESGVEVEADLVLLRPVDPVREVLRHYGVAVDEFAAAKLGVAGVKGDAVLAGDVGEHLLHVGAEFVGVARLAGVVAGDGEAVAEAGGFAQMLEAADIVALPALD